MKLGVREQNCNPSILEVEAGEHKLKASLGYIRKSTFKSKWRRERYRETERQREGRFFFLKHRSSDSLGPRYTSVQRQRLSHQ